MTPTAQQLVRAVLGAAAIAGLAMSASAQQSPAVPPLTAFFQPAADAPTTPDADGFIRRWLLLEPVVKPNPTNTVFTGSYVRAALNPGTFPGQFGTVPRDGQTVEAGGTLRWHALDSRLWDVKLFNFAQALGKPKYGVVFWAVTVIDSPREMRNVRMAVGSNAASIWWLNGEETATLFDDRRMVMDDVLSDRVTLKKGRNLVYGAVINGPGLSDFCLRFVDEDGRPIRDLRIDVK
ncbi:acetylxylan esterase [Sphingomonas sp. ST-64]|uniref:Acetylxylan esterase n=1 Tax=Sphingomonas plantiphila TaxID=3163295 RepID=A0ABW8YS58_9SPHN